METNKEPLNSSTQLDQAIHLHEFCVELIRQFERTGSIETLNSSADAIEKALELTPEDHPNLALYLTVRSVVLRTRCRLNGLLQDADNAVTSVEEAIKLTQFDDSSNRSLRFSNLGCALLIRYEITKSAADLNGAVSANEEAVQSILPDHPGRSAFLCTLYLARIAQFEMTKSLDDLNRAVNTIKEAVDSASQNDPLRGGYSNNLGLALRHLYNETRSIENLNSSVEASKEAVRLTPYNQFNRIVFLDNLAISLNLRFENTESPDDLDAMVQARASAAKTISLAHPDRPAYWSSFSNALYIRFERTGSISDLNSAVFACRIATSDEKSAKPAYFNGLSTVLQNRFLRMGSIEDLHAAVEASIQAVKRSPPGNPTRSFSLMTLGSALEHRFERTGSLSDLNASIEATTDALALTSPSDPLRPGHLHNYSLSLLLRFDRVGNIDDLNAAVDASRETLSIIPHNHPKRPIVLNSLSQALQRRFKHSKLRKDDLTAAINASEEALKLIPHEHPFRAINLATFGLVLKMKFNSTQSMDDLNASVNAYEESACSKLSPPRICIDSAIEAANLILPHDPQRASQLLITAVQLLPTTSPRMLQRTDKQFALSKNFRLTSDAVALLLRTDSTGDVWESLRLLEIGRGVLASAYFDARSVITNLETTHPDLANEFKRCREYLDKVTNNLHLGQFPDNSFSQSQISSELLTLRRYEIVEQFEGVVKSIRSKEGFANFLLPPSAEEFKRLASLGPIIVVNVSRLGGDALVVTPRDIRSISLAKLTYDELEMNAKRLLEIVKGARLSTWSRCNTELTQILQWLWDVMAEPILGALQFTKTPERDDEWPRVWWIPTGPLCLLPIHAAGYYSKGNHQTVLDRVISSYATTARSLDYAREQTANFIRTSSQAALLACMVDTPKLDTLKSAAQEVDAVDNCLPSPIKTLKFQNSTKEDIMKAIDQCSIVHFACHGEIDGDPSKSRILLSDWETNPLSVVDISQKKLDQAEFAYISACNTATSKDFSLLDESIHMAAAFQLAGFPSVIGTLWRIEDQCSSVIAEIVYRKMLGDNGVLDIQKAAQSLHFALRETRDKYWKESRFKSCQPLLWAPYLYVGI